MATPSLKVMTEKIKPTSSVLTKKVKVKVKVMKRTRTNQLSVDEEGGDANYPHFLPDNQIGVLIVAIMMMMMMMMMMKMAMINKFVLFIRGQLSFHASHKAKYSLIIHFDQQRSCSSSLQ